VTVLQPGFVDELPVNARRHATVVPNAVQRLCPPSNQPRRHRILGAGRLTDIKRYDVLIEAYARLAEEFPAWDLVICGEGPERERLEELVDRLGLADRISLPGAVPDIGRFYDEARILGHPAAFEGFGLAVAEGILHGLGVVASSTCWGVDRLIEPGVTGLLVDEEDDPIMAFAMGLRELIIDPPPDEVRRAGMNRLADELDPDRVIDLWEQVLQVT
jgi:glycosyltransferase involved in cell wall biosynthesis